MPTLPEFKLLADCCHASFAAAARPQIAMPEATVDWPRFVRLARFHRVQGIAWNALSSSGHQIPAAAAEALSDDSSEIAATNLRAAILGRDLLEDSRTAGIEVLFLKGLTTGALAYRDPLLKMSSDLDLLISPAGLGEAAALLRSRGFEPLVPAEMDDLGAWHRQHKESLWRRGDGLQIDLHTRLADNPALIPGLGVDSPKQDVEVVPGVYLPTLAADELVAYLCVHGASSAWFRLKWISDLAGILYPWDDLPRVQSRCQALGAGRASAQALLLMAKVFDLPGRVQIDRQLSPDRSTRWLVASSIRQLGMTREPAEPTATPFGTARIHLSQLLLLRGVKFKVAEAWRQARHALSHAHDRQRARKTSG